MSSDKTTILTCPSCATRYNVKASAIPPEGRTVRCAACGNKWHVDPDPDDVAPSAMDAPEETAQGMATSEPRAMETDAPPARDPTPTPPPVPQPVETPPPPPEPTASAADAPREAVLASPPEPEVAAAVEEQQAAQEEVIDERVTDHPFDEAPAADAGFTGIDPIEDHDDEEELDAPRSRWWLWLLVLVVLVAAAIAALFTVAPAEWRQQLGVGGVVAEESPFDVILTRQNMSTLESGQRMLSVTGRVVNVTEDAAAIPPIHAELRDENEAVLHEWTIAPPAPSLGPGESATFNSAEADIPDGGSRIVMVVGG